ncbi:uncharacterized protein HaLaN_22640, partial [Haematococcus lacustris]
VRAREEKAVAEKSQLEQKLKLQRVELQRHVNAVQSAEDLARAEIHAVTCDATSLKHNIEVEASGTRGSDHDSYLGDHMNVSKE